MLLAMVAAKISLIGFRKSSKPIELVIFNFTEVEAFFVV